MNGFRSGCPIASSLDIVGDKWSLVIVRSLAMGATSYSDLARQPEKIATNILSDRLARLERSGIVRQTEAGRGRLPGRYGLTRKGADLLPVIQALARWGEAHLDDRWRPPARFYALRSKDIVVPEAR